MFSAPFSQTPLFHAFPFEREYSYKIKSKIVGLYSFMFVSLDKRREDKTF
jgi:hypothetical protein